jgi:hypothetical protein
MICSSRVLCGVLTISRTVVVADPLCVVVVDEDWTACCRLLFT